MQRVASPRDFCERTSSCTRVTTIRAPLAPIGCPSATAPPLTLNCSSEKPNSRWTAIDADAYASLCSTRSKSVGRSPVCRRCFFTVGIGDSMTSRGWTPLSAAEWIHAIGFAPRSRTSRALARTRAAAPSDNFEEFPAVRIPSGANTGFRRASFSKVVSARGASSWSRPSPPGVASRGTGVSSDENVPAATAFAARRWLRRP